MGSNNPGIDWAGIRFTGKLQTCSILGMETCPVDPASWWNHGAEQWDTWKSEENIIERPSWKHFFIVGIAKSAISYLCLWIPCQRGPLYPVVDFPLRARLPFASSGKCCGGCNSVGCLRGIRGMAEFKKTSIMMVYESLDIIMVW